MIDLSDRTDLTALTGLVAAIRQAWPDRELLLVGATARDVLLSYAHGIPVERATLDIDFAVAVADWEDYLELRNILLAGGVFIEDPRVLHRLLLPPHTKLDLIPFGGVERDDRTIAWPPAGNEVMQVIGYREAMGDAVLVHLPAGQEVRVVSLRALAVLKLFAWRDRHVHTPQKDAADLWLILTHYLEAGNEDRLYADATHLFEAADYDYSRAGAWLLGSDIRELLSDTDNGALQATMALLATEIDPAGRLLLAREMKRTEVEVALGLLAAMHAGMAGERTP